MTTYCYDLETYPNYFLAVFQDVESKDFLSFDHRTDQMKALCTLIEDESNTFISWNGAHFDDPLLRYILKHRTVHTTKPNKLIRNAKKKQTTTYVTAERIADLAQLIINTDKNDEPARQKLRNTFGETLYPNYLNKEYKPFVSIDIKALLDPMPSLKKTEVRLRFSNVEDLPFPVRDLTPNEKTKVHEYCKNDVAATLHVYETQAKPHLELRHHLSHRFGVQKLESLSEPRTAEKILLELYTTEFNNNIPEGVTPATLGEMRRANERNIEKYMGGIAAPIENFVPDWIEFEGELQYVLEDFKAMRLPVNRNTGHPDGSQLKRKISIGSKEYQTGVGGLHSIDNSELLKADGFKIIDTDVASYYPAILIRDSLYPSQFNKPWINIYSKIRDLRLEAKKKGEKLDANALKIILNATFGKLASQYSPFYDPHLLTRITVTGQLALLMLIEKFYLAGIEVLSANTDGITVKLLPDQEDAFEHCKQEWMEHTRFDLEDTEFSVIARRDVNAYVAKTPDDKLKRKGIFAEHGLKKDVQAPIITEMAIEYLINETQLEKTMNNPKWTIYDFLFSFSATSAFEITLDNKPMTKTNRWYRTTLQENQLYKHGGKLQNTSRIPHATNIQIVNRITDETIPDDLDRRYYLTQARKLITTVLKND